MVWGERFLDGLVLARHQIDAELISKRDQIASGMTVTFDILGNQVARCQPPPLIIIRSFSPCLSFIVLLSARSSAALRSRCNQKRFPSGALRIATLSGLEPKLLWRAARPDFVLLVGRLGPRGGRIGAAIVGVFQHICSP